MQIQRAAAVAIADLEVAREATDALRATLLELLAQYLHHSLELALIRHPCGCRPPRAGKQRASKRPSTPVFLPTRPESPLVDVRVSEGQD
eukprot:scaffold119955_cov50-Phaeocystis_antarctica.AAC.2